VPLANSARMEDSSNESCTCPTLRQTIDETKASWARSKTIVTPSHVPAEHPSRESTASIPDLSGNRAARQRV